MTAAASASGGASLRTRAQCIVQQHAAAHGSRARTSRQRTAAHSSQQQSTQEQPDLEAEGGGGLLPGGCIVHVLQHDRALHVACERLARSAVDAHDEASFQVARAPHSAASSNSRCRACASGSASAFSLFQAVAENGEVLWEGRWDESRNERRRMGGGWLGKKISTSSDFLEI